MQFHVAPEIFDRFPGMRIAVAVAHDVDNTLERSDLSADWHKAWSEAAQCAAPHGNAQSHPRVRPWREHFRAIGISGKEFPSSIEAVLRRAMKDGQPFSINPLVDFYNTVSLRHTVPAGGFDLDDLHQPLELHLTRDGDLFTSLELETVVPVPPGEVAYAGGSRTVDWTMGQNEPRVIVTEGEGTCQHHRSARRKTELAWHHWRGVPIS